MEKRLRDDSSGDSQVGHHPTIDDEVNICDVVACLEEAAHVLIADDDVSNIGDILESKKKVRECLTPNTLVKLLTQFNRDDDVVRGLLQRTLESQSASLSKVLCQCFEDCLKAYENGAEQKEEGAMFWTACVDVLGPFLMQTVCFDELELAFPAVAPLTMLVVRVATTATGDLTGNHHHKGAAVKEQLGKLFTTHFEGNLVAFQRVFNVDDIRSNENKIVIDFLDEETKLIQVVLSSTLLVSDDGSSSCVDPLLTVSYLSTVGLIFRHRLHHLLNRDYMRGLKCLLDTHMEDGFLHSLVTPTAFSSVAMIFSHNPQILSPDELSLKNPQLQRSLEQLLESVSCFLSSTEMIEGSPAKFAALTALRCAVSTQIGRVRLGATIQKIIHERIVAVNSGGSTRHKELRGPLLELLEEIVQCEDALFATEMISRDCLLGTVWGRWRTDMDKDVRLASWKVILGVLLGRVPALVEMMSTPCAAFLSGESTANNEYDPVLDGLKRKCSDSLLKLPKLRPFHPKLLERFSKAAGSRNNNVPPQVVSDYKR